MNSGGGMSLRKENLSEKVKVEPNQVMGHSGLKTV